MTTHSNICRTQRRAVRLQSRVLLTKTHQAERSCTGVNVLSLQYVSVHGMHTMHSLLTRAADTQGHTPKLERSWQAVALFPAAASPKLHASTEQHSQHSARGGCCHTGAAHVMKRTLSWNARH